MKKYSYIIMYMGKSVGVGTLAAYKQSSIPSRLAKLYGKKSQGFSWHIVEML